LLLAGVAVIVHRPDTSEANYGAESAKTEIDGAAWRAESNRGSARQGSGEADCRVVL